METSPMLAFISHLPPPPYTLLTPSPPLFQLSQQALLPQPLPHKPLSCLAHPQTVTFPHSHKFHNKLAVPGVIQWPAFLAHFHLLKDLRQPLQRWRLQKYQKLPPTTPCLVLRLAFRLAFPQLACHSFQRPVVHTCNTWRSSYEMPMKN